MVPDAYGSNAYTNFLIENACLLLRIYAFLLGLYPCMHDGEVV